MKMEYEIYTSIEVALRGAIRRAFEWRNEDDNYWRRELKKDIKALRFVRKEWNKKYEN